LISNITFNIAFNSLVLIYEKGKDIERAIYWYKKSAKQEYQKSQYNLIMEMELIKIYIKQFIGLKNRISKAHRR